MPFDLSIIGKKSDVHRHAYRWRDVALYALSVGADQRELSYVYEGADRAVLPTYAVIPTLEPCRELLGKLAGGFEGLVHRYERVVFHEDMAPEGETCTLGEIVDVCGRGSIAEVTGRTWTHDTRGKLLSETEFSVVYVGMEVQTGPSAVRRKKVMPPRTAPDHRVQERTHDVQSLLYRLNGDDNPIHVDPAWARKAGFERPILHGLCTFGYVCRAAIRCAGQGRRLRSLEAEFRKPAFPGDTLDLSAWADGADLVMQVGTVERPAETVLQSVKAVFE
ncbi:MAG: MaoC/PaaZ C-terminal domain-containing protein [Thermoanaerobaculia bacterium]